MSSVPRETWPPAREVTLPTSGDPVVDQDELVWQRFMLDIDVDKTVMEYNCRRCCNHAVRFCLTWLLNYKDFMIIFFNTLRPTQDGRHFPDDISKCLSWMKVLEFSQRLFLSFQLKIFQHWLYTNSEISEKSEIRDGISSGFVLNCSNPLNYT